MNLTPEMILRGYQANTAALEEMIFVKGKVAVVTGGTSGLGFCVARRLCQGGAKVVLASSTQEKGDLAVRLLKEEGFDTVFCKTDVRNEEEVKHLISFTAETYGSIDILVRRMFFRVFFRSRAAASHRADRSGTARRTRGKLAVSFFLSSVYHSSCRY